MNFLEKLLEKLAKFQFKYSYIILIISLVITAIMINGVTKIEFSGDIDEEMPQQLPIYQLNNKISDIFSGQDTMFILLELDDSLEMQNTPKDIRDKEIMEYLVSLDEELSQETSIDEIISLAPIINALKLNYGELNNELIKEAFESSDVNSLINDKKTMTIMILNADVGGGQDKVLALTEMIEEKINGLSCPSGVEITITGTPSIISTILDLLKQDAVYTLLLASVIILILLFIIERSFSKGFLIFILIFLGLIWTLGTMGYLGIKINMATAGLGAMILGLGVEYGVFMLTRYHEERDKNKSQIESIKEAVPSVGNAVIGSGSTTMIGFLALNLSIMPMLQHLGQSLALGIFYCIIASVVIQPAFLILEEKFENWYTHKKHDSIVKKKNKLKKH